MIDFEKLVKNTDKFREPALLFLTAGHYCAFPPGTTEYHVYWDELTRRCLEGYTAADGDYITGYNYFYLNFCPMHRLVYVMKHNKSVLTLEVTFPDFWDYDYYFYNAVLDALDLGKHLAVLKSRRKGYSYKGASMLCRNYYLMPESKSYVYASSKLYLTDDGILTKAWSYMDFIDKNTAWGKKRTVNTTMRKRAGFMTKDDFGNEVEMGYKSEIIGVTIKDNPDIVRGKKALLILWEEAGSNKELGAAWEIARPSVEADGVAFGTMIAFGTGGDKGSNNFAALKNMFYDPKSANCLELDNIWDDGGTGSKCGFFVPLYANIDLRDLNTNLRLYMDTDGNTLKGPALSEILRLRHEVMENANSTIAIDRYVCERCITPAEACLEFNGNLFPRKELLQLLATIRSNKLLKNYKQVGDLIFDETGLLKWVPKKLGDIDHYPLKKDDDPTGAIVIWEHPNKDAGNGLYISGCLTPGQKVLTDKGFKAVEHVDFNDTLVSKDGQYVKIRNLQRYLKVNELIYQIRTSNSYSTTIFTGEHPIYVADQVDPIDEAKLVFQFKKAKDLKVGQWIKYPNLYTDQNNFDINTLWDNNGYRCDRQIASPLTNKDFWWFVGLWLGDGWCDGDYKVSISFNAVETCFIDRFKRICTLLFKRHYTSRVRGNCVEISTNFLQLNRFMTANFGKYAYGKYIPEWAKRIDSDLKKALLQGYLGDSTHIICANLALLENILDITFSLEIISSIEKCESKHGIKQYYQLNLTSNGQKDGCFFSNDGKYIYFKIREILLSIYTGTVYNFECDTHTYICRHITTHNCDPYDHDLSNSGSLGSVFIYKRILNLELYSDILVAEYTGRPLFADDFYETVRKLLLYYNARLMYENLNKGLFVYFTLKHCDYLLADQPDIISDIVGVTKVLRRKGCHMSKQIKQWGEGLIKDWLNEINANGKKNLYNILSEPLLEELIAYNGTLNTDRVMALMQVMIYREQLYNVVVKEKNKENKARVLFEGPIFAQDWFDDEPKLNFDNNNVYTF